MSWTVKRGHCGERVMMMFHLAHTEGRLFSILWKNTRTCLQSLFGGFDKLEICAGFLFYHTRLWTYGNSLIPRVNKKRVKHVTLLILFQIKARVLLPSLAALSARLQFSVALQLGSVPVSLFVEFVSSESRISRDLFVAEGYVKQLDGWPSVTSAPFEAPLSELQSHRVIEWEYRYVALNVDLTYSHCTLGANSVLSEPIRGPVS